MLVLPSISEKLPLLKMGALCNVKVAQKLHGFGFVDMYGCLLYTSDAADE